MAKIDLCRRGGGLFLKEALDDFRKLVGVHLGGSLEHLGFFKVRVAAHFCGALFCELIEVDPRL